jgi:hypothetical protein
MEWNMLAYENLIYDKPADGVARITLNRPDQLDALNVPLLYDIYAAADEETVLSLAHDDEETVLSLAHDMVAIERANPGCIRANKFQINANHPQHWIGTTLNPAVMENAPFESDFAILTRQHQEHFFADLAERGFKAAVDDMHQGYTTRD